MLMKDNNSNLDGYFYNHAVGIYPGQKELLTSEMAAFGQAWVDPVSGQWAYAEKIYQEYLEHWAHLLNASASNLAPSENVTSGLMSVISSLPDSVLKNKKLLIAADCFPSLYFLLDGLKDRYGYELLCVGEKGTRYPVSEDEILSAWTEDVGFALLTWVSSTTSARQNLEKMVAHAQEMSTVVCADITQGVGIIPFDAQKSGVDFALSTSLKWVCGGPGAGIIYTSSNYIEKCYPEFRGWYGQENPFDWDLNTFDVANGGRRFLNGTPSYWPYAAALPGLRWHKETGMENIYGHNRLISGQMIDWFEQHGLEIVTPLASDNRGGSVMVRMSDAIDLSALVNRLKECNVFVDNRSSILRLSPGITSSTSGLERFFSLMEKSLEECQLLV